MDFALQLWGLNIAYAPPLSRGALEEEGGQKEVRRGPWQVHGLGNTAKDVEGQFAREIYIILYIPSHSRTALWYND